MLGNVVMNKNVFKGDSTMLIASVHPAQTAITTHHHPSPPITTHHHPSPTAAAFASRANLPLRLGKVAKSPARTLGNLAPGTLPGK